MLKNAILSAAVVLSSASAFAEFKGLGCLGTEPFWSLDVDVVKSKMTYTSPDNLKGSAYKMSQPSQAVGLQENMVMVFKAAKKDVSATVISSDLAGKKCSDGMSENEYSFHVVYRNGANVVYGCCEPKAQD